MCDMNAYPQCIKNAFEELNKIYSVHDWYFPKSKVDKKSRIQELVDNFINHIEKDIQKETYCSFAPVLNYIKGKALNSGQEYSEKAENFLTKAVKLNPSFAEAWVALGICIWRKGDKAHVKLQTL